MASAGEQPGGPAEGPADEATAVVTADGTLVGWTLGAEQLLGHRAADIVGRPGETLIAPADRSRATRIARACLTGTGWRGMITLRDHIGREVPTDLSVSAAFPMAHLGDCFLITGHPRHPEQAIGESVLDGFLTRSPVGMAVMDPELRYVWINDMLERFGGVPREQRLGRKLSEVMPGLQAEKLETLMGEVLVTGAPVMDHEYRGWSWADPHHEHAYSTSFFPLTDPDGTVTGVCYMVSDVTDRWAAQQRLVFMNDAGARLGRSLDVLRTAQELADVVVPRFADLALIDLLDSALSTEDLPPLTPDGMPGMFRAGLQSVRPGAPEALARVGEPVEFVPPPHDMTYLLDGEGVIIPVLDADRQEWAEGEPERADRIRDFSLHSMISVPLRARDTVLGLATFIRSENLASFAPDDLLLARELAARAAVGLENARRYTRERNTALTLQRNLLPQALAGVTGLETAYVYLPAEAKDGVGGDWFDVLPLSSARVGLVVGDVVGHGITAAATMGRLRTAVHTLADMDLPPAELLAHLDDLVIRLTEEEPPDGVTGSAVLGATCLYAVYDPVTRQCELARAGHPPPVVVAPDGTVGYPELPVGPPLGLGGMPFESGTMELAEGSTIGLYTDGLIEGIDRDVDLGMRRLAEILARTGLPLDDLCAEAVRRLVPGPQPDDVALLLARPRPLKPTQVRSWDIPFDPSAVAGARADVADQLDAWGLDELKMPTELIVSELLANALRYATGPLRLRLLRHHVLTCEVSDTSSTSPRMRHARALDENGRGLFLVAQLTRRWGTRHTPEGKTIWAEQELPHPTARRPGGQDATDPS